jgi:predicted nucleotidyltransferase
MPTSEESLPLLPYDVLAEFCRRWLITELALLPIVDNVEGEEATFDFIARYSEEADWSLLDISRAELELEALLGHRVRLTSRTAVQSDPNAIRRKSRTAEARTLYSQ